MLPKAALVRSRKAIESLYADTCRIITEKDTIDPDTGIVNTARVTSAEYHCRISYKNLPVTGGDGIPVMTQSVTLFLSPKIDVPAGADVDVVRQGRHLHFKSAGVSAVYDNHQEISLKHRKVHDG
ncbi:hypothetical protein [Dialister invisus]|uniref:hypothetical protein n=1 Tax=Dialister invisus TaxID=218538 RepID=UPI003995DBA2